jgi:acetylornithine/succinyldiaminopimelate/putrescine aminotransferase
MLGLGLMLGIELTENVKPYILLLMDLGVLALPAGKNTLRFLPPLTITPQQIDKVVFAVKQVLN